jgi:hypothetical protein
MIFSRNIVTAETAEYDNCEQAGNAKDHTLRIGTDIYRPSVQKGTRGALTLRLWNGCPTRTRLPQMSSNCTRRGSVKAVGHLTHLGLEPITTFDSVSAAPGF